MNEPAVNIESQELLNLLQKREALIKELSESEDKLDKIALRIEVDTLTQHINQLRHYLIKVKF